MIWRRNQHAVLRLEVRLLSMVYLCTSMVEFDARSASSGESGVGEYHKQCEAACFDHWMKDNFAIHKLLSSEDGLRMTPDLWTSWHSYMKNVTIQCAEAKILTPTTFTYSCIDTKWQWELPLTIAQDPTIRFKSYHRSREVRDKIDYLISCDDMSTEDVDYVVSTTPTTIKYSQTQSLRGLCIPVGKELKQPVRAKTRDCLKTRVTSRMKRIVAYIKPFRGPYKDEHVIGFKLPWKQTLNDYIEVFEAGKVDNLVHRDHIQSLVWTNIHPQRDWIVGSCTQAGMFDSELVLAPIVF